MSFIEGERSLGTCRACGAPVYDAGQSGAHCSNDCCPNSYWGGKTPERAIADQHERERQSMLQRKGWWAVGATWRRNGHDERYSWTPCPTRAEAEQYMAIYRDQGATVFEFFHNQDGVEWVRRTAAPDPASGFA
jgi:hypothetical protein